MGIFVKGDVIVLNYPFSDFSKLKRRPAVVLANSGDEDLLVCLITSQQKRDEYAVSIESGDFAIGSLNYPSIARPNRVATAERAIVLYRVGRLGAEKTEEIVNSLIRLLKQS